MWFSSGVDLWELVSAYYVSGCAGQGAGKLRATPNPGEYIIIHVIVIVRTCEAKLVWKRAQKVKDCVASMMRS